MNHEYKKKYLKYKRKYLNLEISRIKGGNKQIGGSTYIIISGLLILITAVLTATIILGAIPNPETNMYITQLTDKDKVNKKLNEQLKQFKETISQNKEQFKDLKKRLTSCESTNTYIVTIKVLSNKIEDIFTKMEFDNFDNFKTNFSNELSKITLYQTIENIGKVLTKIIYINSRLIKDIVNSQKLQTKLNELRQGKPKDLKQELKKDLEIVTLFEKIIEKMNPFNPNIVKLFEKIIANMSPNIKSIIKTHGSDMDHIRKRMSLNNLNIEVIYDIFIKHINNPKETPNLGDEIAKTGVYKNLSLLNNFIESLIKPTLSDFRDYIDTLKDIKQLRQWHNNTKNNEFLKGIGEIFSKKYKVGLDIIKLLDDLIIKMSDEKDEQKKKEKEEQNEKVKKVRRNTT